MVDLPQEDNRSPRAKHKAQAAFHGDIASDPVQIGPYRISARLGEGAIGIVYAADQTEPVQRKVAVKVIKVGMNSRRVLQRFQREQQTLAGLNHPYIARIFDSAVLNDTPYFAMEYVDGLPLTDFCNQHHHRFQQRLQLFVKIAEAVGYAHQRGVIHRDLKPANILVTHIGKEPIPKIIDFGMAKVIGDTAATPSPAQTRQGLVIGTPAYMSPEQREGRGNTDTRADLYSLAVVLYELLLGRLPDPSKTKSVLSSHAFEHTGEAAPAPSIARHFHRMTTEARRAAAKLQNTSPNALRKNLAGDLDAVLRKALSPARDHRYQSVGLFRDDCERILAGEPVHIDHGTLPQQTLRFFKRFRVPVLVFGTVTGLLLTGTVLSVQGINRAEAGRRQALAQAERARTIQGHLNHFLQSADTDNPEVSLLTLLIRYSDQLTPETEADPLIRAMLHHTAATTFMNLGETERAEKHIAQAASLRAAGLPKDHPDLLESRRILGAVYRALGRAKEAEQVHREVLAGSLARHGEDHPDTILARSELGLDLRELGFIDESIQLNRAVLEARRRVLGENHPSTLSSMNTVAVDLSSAGEHEQAKEMLQRIISVRREKYGNDHPRTLLAQLNLGVTLIQQKKPQEAVPILEKVHVAHERILQKTHHKTLSSANKLATAYLMLGRINDAEPIYREYLPLAKRHFGADNPRTLNLAANYLFVHIKLKQYDEATALADGNWRGFRKLHGDNHRVTLRALKNYAAVLKRAGTNEKNLKTAKMILVEMDGILPADNAVIQRVALFLRDGYRSRRQTKQAAAVTEKYGLNP